MNLISVGVLLSTQLFDVFFVKNSCIIQDRPHQRVIGRCDLINGLFPFKACIPPHTSQSDLPNICNSVCCTSLVPLDQSVSCNITDALSSSVTCNVVPHFSDLASLWHARMGHVSDSVLHSLSNNVPFSFNNKFTSNDCIICPLAKQKCLPFPAQNHASPTMFDLIHYDTWGPFAKQTHDGYHYFSQL